MTKLSKLKMFNILVFALIPLLVVAMVTTVTLAAMTAGGYGQNTINIGSIGTMTSSATATAIYPGKQGATATVTCNYNPHKDGVKYNAQKVKVTIEQIRYIEFYKGDTVISTINVSRTPTGVSFGDIGPILGITMDKVTADIEINKSTTFTLTFNVKEGKNSGIVADSTDPQNYLVNSVTRFKIFFKMQIDPASGTTYQTS